MTGIILAGGSNSRINQPKAFLHVSENSIIDNTLRILEKNFDKVIIVTNNENLYTHFGYPVVRDIYKKMGPLGGIHTGLKYSDTHYNFFIACDMPFINNSIIARLKSARFGFDAIVPEHDGYYEPLCAIYSKNCLDIIEKNLNEGKKCIRNIYMDVKLHVIQWQEGNLINNHPAVFFNINTPSNLQQAKDYLVKNKPIC